MHQKALRNRCSTRFRLNIEHIMGRSYAHLGRRSPVVEIEGAPSLGDWKMSKRSPKDKTTARLCRGSPSGGGEQSAMAQ
jgi:hypothetical protein